MSQKLIVHDPRGYPPKIVGKRLAPRLSTLEGKTIYLVDCLFDNSDVFMDQLKHWFGERLPGGERPDDPAEGNLVRRPGDACQHCRRWRRRDPRRRSLKYLQPDGRRVGGGAGTRRNSVGGGAHQRVRAALQSHGAFHGHATPAPGVRATASGRPLADRPANIHRRHRSRLGATLHAGGARWPHRPARRSGPAGRVVRSHDATTARARNGRSPAAAVRGKLLDRFSASHTADRGARGGDAQGDEPSSRRGSRTTPSDGVSRILGIHRGKGGGERRHGRRAARVTSR